MQRLSRRLLSLYFPLFLFLSFGCNKAVLFALSCRYRSQRVDFYSFCWFIYLQKHYMVARNSAENIFTTLSLSDRERTRERAYEICLSEVMRWLTIVLWQSLKYAKAQAHMQRLEMSHTRNMFINIVFFIAKRANPINTLVRHQRSQHCPVWSWKRHNISNENQVSMLRQQCFD